MIVSQYSPTYSHWNAERSLGQWLKDEGIPALTGIDTRALTKKIREKGVMLGKIVIDADVPFRDPNESNLVAEVSIKQPQTFGKGQYKIIAVDCGIKSNIIRSLVELGDTTVKVVPWNYDFTKEDYDGLFISNGPGDPSMVKETVDNIRKAMDIGKPIFGICLGNQLMARAAGASTYKLKFGNRGQNQPCVDLVTSRVYITPQNHGFAVDNQTLPMGWKPYFINVNDGTNEGLLHSSKPFFSVQFHPEARAGPQDTSFLFRKFYDSIIQEKGKKVHSGASVYANPKRPVDKVLILGSGALQIGQAGEFDYSGSQCIKALKESDIQTVLINPNIATVQTSKEMADRTYYLPVTTQMVEQVIAKEKPDGILLGFGGQTALNTGIALHEEGILSKYKVKVLGTQVDSIIAAEDRQIFADKLIEIGEKLAPSIAATNIEDALVAAEKIGYPIIIRSAFSLGGLGSGFCYNPTELKEMAAKAFASSPQILVEKSIKGWKEVEYEVVRDANDNCITVCNMENFDPMGIHTGESIVVAPSQTLSNDEYHMLRSAAIRTIKHLNIVGECNIQYALDPHSQDYCIIEVNPRLSRSSALASKATGYPLAFVAAKLSLGITLPEVQNSVTKTTSACFEPSLDYIVTKIPRWDLKKFTRSNFRLGSSMKSVGEVMAIGRSFEESFQKALRMVDPSNVGFQSKKPRQELEEELKNPTPERPFAIALAFDKGYTVDQIHELTKIDRWFLDKLKGIKETEKELGGLKSIEKVSFALMEKAKQQGFSDEQIGRIVKSSEDEVRVFRKKMNVLPKVKQIDTLAAEFPAKTNYLYMTYNAAVSDLPEDKDGYLVLGSGVYRIGSSVEFDYCSTKTASYLRKLGHKSIMVNYNPETVSTDYDESDKLYFEELSLERVLDIYERESPKGVVVSMGGQQPQNIAMALHRHGVRILGTHPHNIDMAEDRYKFSKMLDSIGVDQPEWKELKTMDEATSFATKVGYPVLVRPSYVLSGAAMKVAYNSKELVDYLGVAASVSPLHPVVISKFIEGAREIECDAVAQKGKLINWAVSEHVENAGVHSGDATMVLPSDNVGPKLHSKLVQISAKIAVALDISGPLNVQYIVKGNDIKVIECNLRASRSFPFVSKTYNIDFIETATRIFLGEQLQPNPKCDAPLPHVCVKFPMFSFQRLLGSDPVLGVEMASTGEVACFGHNKYEAFLKAMYSIPAMRHADKHKTFLVSGAINDEFAPYAKQLTELGYKLYATPEAQAPLQKAKVQYTQVDAKTAVDMLRKKAIELTINFPHRAEDEHQYNIRRSTVDFAVPIITNQQVAQFFITALQKSGPLKPLSYQEYWPETIGASGTRFSQAAAAALAK